MPKRKFIKFPVHVQQEAIDNARPCDAMLCMHKVSMESSLRKFPGEGSKDHKVRIDAGHFKFILKGWRWKGDTPKKAATSMILWDNPKTRDQVEPHSWTAKAYQTTKIVKISPARQQQINEARRERIASGSQEHKRRYTLRDRIIGYDLGRG